MINIVIEIMKTITIKMMFIEMKNVIMNKM